MTDAPSRRIAFMLYDLRTRRLLPGKKIVRTLAQVEAHLDEGIGWVRGHHNRHEVFVHPDADGPDAKLRKITKKALAAGLVAPLPAPTEYVPAAAEVKVEAERRIVSRYPVHKQMNVIRAGGDDLAAMSKFIDGIRMVSNQLEAMTPIPADYGDDHWWPN